MDNLTNISPEAQVETAKPLHKDIQAIIDAIPARIEKLKSFNAVMHIAGDLEAVFKAEYMWKDLSEFSDRVLVSFRFSSMSDAAALLRYITVTHGLHQNADMRIYENDKSLNWTFPGLRIVGHFDNENAKCKFVKTGTKIVDVFEIQCDGAELVTA